MHYRIKWGVVEICSAIALMLSLFVLFVLVFTPDAFAQTQIPGTGSEVAPQPEGDILTGLNIQQFLVNAAATAIGYALNYTAPWISEQAKGVFMILLNAAVGAAYVAFSAGDFGFNTVTLVAIVQGVISAAIAHGIFKPTGVAFALGAGRNKDSQPLPVQKALVGSA